MKLLYKISRIGVVFLLLNFIGAMVINSFVLNPDVVDTHLSVAGMYFDEPRVVYYGRGPLSSSPPAIFLLGASNVREGFLVKDLNHYDNNKTVHNLAIGASNFTQIGQVVDLIYDAIPHRAEGGNLFVLGCWYGLFVQDEVRWRGGDTDLQNEMLRYGLYRRDNSFLKPRLPLWAEHYAIELMKPYFYLNYQYKTLKTLGSTRANQENGDLEGIVVTKEMQGKALKFWDQYMGDINADYFVEQSSVLAKIIKKIHSRNDRILIVDMPLPLWHSQASPFYSRNKEVMLSLLTAYPSVGQVSLGEYPDATFYSDSAHPKPSTAIRWSRTLKEKINNYEKSTLRRI